MNHQVFVMHEIDALYHPIPVPGDSMRQMVPTDPETLERAEKMKDECTHLKTEMMEEIMAIDTKLVRAATDAKDSIKPMKKVIKKREDRKVSTAIPLCLLLLTLSSLTTSATIAASILRKRKLRIASSERL